LPFSQFSFFFFFFYTLKKKQNNNNNNNNMCGIFAVYNYQGDIEAYRQRALYLSKK
jgi:hypothetical protein